MPIMNQTLISIMLVNSSYKQLCINQLLPILYKANTIRDYDYRVGNCTFPARSSILQTYGSCSLHATSCGGNETSGVTYEQNLCKAPISWYNDDMDYSMTYWHFNDTNSLQCNPSVLG